MISEIANHIHKVLRLKIKLPSRLVVSKTWFYLIKDARFLTRLRARQLIASL